jgi:hypothetical protein
MLPEFSGLSKKPHRIGTSRGSNASGVSVMNSLLLIRFFKAKRPVSPHDGLMGRNLRAEIRPASPSMKGVVALHCLDLKRKQRIKVTCPH